MKIATNSLSKKLKNYEKQKLIGYIIDLEIIQVVLNQAVAITDFFLERGNSVNQRA